MQGHHKHTIDLYNDIIVYFIFEIMVVVISQKFKFSVPQLLNVREA